MILGRFPAAGPYAGLAKSYGAYVVPNVNLTHAPADQWYPTRGFQTVPASPDAMAANAPETASLAFASHLTAHAFRTVPNGGKAETAAGLHMLAAELRRESECWLLCLENYDALTRHYLKLRRPKMAVANLRRLVFVSKHAPEASRFETNLLAAEVYVSVGNIEAALSAATAAKAYAVTASLKDQARADGIFGQVTRAREHIAMGGNPGEIGICACGGWLVCRPCHGRTEETPAEFDVRAVGIPSSPSRPASSPWWSSRKSGGGVMLNKPGPEGETPYWVAHGVSHGDHVVLALPNWSGRAMSAARMMHRYSQDNPDGTECPSSAVLQVVTGLEAFINAAIHFISPDGAAAWSRYKDLPTHIFNTGASRLQGSLHQRWGWVGTGIFGKEWAEKARLKDFEMLIEVRHAIVHFKGSDADQLAPRLYNPVMNFFENHQGYKDVPDAIRPGPMPWIDRLLTPHFAGWVVALGEHMISSFRDAWHDIAKADEAREKLYEIQEVEARELPDLDTDCSECDAMDMGFEPHEDRVECNGCRDEADHGLSLADGIIPPLQARLGSGVDPAQGGGQPGPSRERPLGPPHRTKPALDQYGSPRLGPHTNS